MKTLILAVVSLGCVADRPFECDESAACARGDQAGVCEPTGFCSFADPSCAASGRRYGDLSGLDLGGTCVPCVAELAGGGGHFCARLQDGALGCWGANDRGQIGDGATTERLLPEAIEEDEAGEPLGAVTSIGLGSAHSCATVDGGAAYCWGGNGSGQAGDSSLEDQVRPSPLPAAGARLIAAGLSHTCWLAGGGAVECIGDNSASQLGADQADLESSLEPVTAIAGGAVSPVVGAGAFHTCAVMEDGSLQCWGGNDAGQIGNGTGENARAPVVVRAPGTTRAAAAGDRFTCAVGTDGSVQCWGDNAAGQLGDGTTEDSDVPTPVALPGEATQIALGDDHACARLRDTSLWCWGSNASGQLGAGGAPSGPVPVREQGVVLVAAAEETTCFLELSGAVLCIGAGSSGERGDGGETGGPEPVAVGLACE